MKGDKNQAADPDMLPEYDFKNGVRGKYYGRIAKNPRVFLVPDKPITSTSERREKRRRWVQAGDYAVEVEFEIVYTAGDNPEPYLEPKTVRFLDEVAQRAEKGDLAYLRKVGRVFQAIDKVPQLPIIADATTLRLLSDLAKEKGGEITVRARVVESAGNRVRVLAGEGGAKKRR